MAALTVMQLLPALQSGGVERGTLEVAAELVKQGHRALVVSAGGALVKPLEALGAQHITYPIGHKSLLSLRFIPVLRHLYQYHRVDIVHARSRLPAWLGYGAWQSLPDSKRPYFVTTAHGLHSVNRYSAIMGAGEAVIAVSQTVQDYLVQQLHIPPQKIRVIYRGVDPQQYFPGYHPPAEWLTSWYQQYPQLYQQPWITLPGRLTRRKGHLDFLELIHALNAPGKPELWGLIVGGADSKHQGYQRELEYIITQQRLPVILTGERADLRNIVALSRLVLSLSTQPESFGRTVLEALSQGIPVVGYAHGGVKEILDTLFPLGAIACGDTTGLAQRVSQLLHCPAPVPSQHPFTLQRMLDQTLALYNQLASHHD